MQVLWFQCSKLTFPIVQESPLLKIFPWLRPWTALGGFQRPQTPQLKFSAATRLRLTGLVRAPTAPVPRLLGVHGLFDSR